MNKILLPVLVLLTLALGGSTYYYYSQLQFFKANPDEISKQEVKALLDKVGRLYALPQDEEPIVATVADPEKLPEAWKNHPFFAKAQAGHKLLMYTRAGKAILYDPVADKIVEVAPVNIGAPQTTAPPTGTQ